MNTFPTYKVLVAVVLVAVFGVGFYKFVLHADPETPVVHEQAAADVTTSTPSATAQMPIDQTVTPASAPSTAPPAVAPTPVAPITINVARAAVAPQAGPGARSDDATARVRVASVPVSKVNSFDQTAASGADGMKRTEPLAPAPSDVRTSAESGATTDALTVAAPTVQQAAASREPEVSDSQITTSVRSEIAAAAPDSNVGVTTTNGVVALAGSVPSQDAVEKARQAARGVAGVKYVDVSALTVSNQ
jgi:hyperosmotically inducible protein